MPSSKPRQTYVPQIVVVGGGCSGAAFAVHLARQARRMVDVAIVEPREIVGAGVAYSTMDPAHRINVPASRMSLIPQDEGHFDRWLRNSGELLDDPSALAWDDELFPRRAAFGRYVNDTLAQAAASGSARIGHVRARATAIVPASDGYLVRRETGPDLAADLVVLAASHPPPSTPAALTAALGSDPRLVRDPWAPNALDVVGVTDDIVVVGTGLTMADVVASLDARGHRGRITAVSRRGQLSRGHAPSSGQIRLERGFSLPTSTRALVAEVRACVALREAAGGTWHAVFDMLRRCGPELWRALPDVERRRFLRHVRPYWDTHRFRVAPQVEAVLRRRIQDGTLEIVTGSLRDVAASGDRIDVALNRRGRTDAEPLVRRAAAVVVTTGPAHGDAVHRTPPLASLLAVGRLRPDPLRLGIHVDPLSRAIGEAGAVDPRLLVVGPLARGAFGELMGLPEITVQAERTALRAAEWIEQRLPV